MSTTTTTTLTTAFEPAATTPIRPRQMTKPQGEGSKVQTEDYREIRRRQHQHADIVIVGAGIVGCAAAVAFGKQGRSVILLEKSLKEPDRIVGELLQPGGVNALEKLGMKGV